MWPNSKEQPLFAGLVVVLLLSVIAWEVAAVATKMKQHRFIGQPIPQSRQITVSGTGKVSAPPDIAVVTAGFTVQGQDARATQAEANQKMTALTAAVKSAGVKPEDIQTSGFSMYPRYVYNQNDPPRIAGFEAQQSAEIRIRDLDRISNILAAASGAGATNISGLQFTIDDPEQLENDARGKAIANARVQAALIAQQLGVQLGRPVSFGESGGLPQPYYARSEASGLGGGDAMPAPTIERGTTEIVSNVSVTYELE
ncbi:MAG: SIMPL domain-containing protein [Candidatus Uhrbacteria bacterium]